jgi:hypothetical protein
MVDAWAGGGNMYNLQYKHDVMHGRWGGGWGGG